MLLFHFFQACIIIKVRTLTRMETAVTQTDDVIITQPPNASMTHLENQADSKPKNSKRSLLSKKRRKAKYKRGGIILSLPGEETADNDPTYNRRDILLKNDVTYKRDCTVLGAACRDIAESERYTRRRGRKRRDSADVVPVATGATMCCCDVTEEGAGCCDCGDGCIGDDSSDCDCDCVLH